MIRWAILINMKKYRVICHNNLSRVNKVLGMGSVCKTVAKPEQV